MLLIYTTLYICARYGDGIEGQMYRYLFTTISCILPVHLLHSSVQLGIRCTSAYDASACICTLLLHFSPIVDTICYSVFKSFFGILFRVDSYYLFSILGVRTKIIEIIDDPDATARHEISDWAFF